MSKIIDLNGLSVAIQNIKTWVLSQIDTVKTWSQGQMDDIKTWTQSSLQSKADRATTLAGYGITDAYTSGQVETRLADLGLLDAASLVEIVYADLAELRNTNTLMPGRFYRIIDYITTTSQAGTNSARHQFDVVVLALSNNTLSEKAWAIQHTDVETDYFHNSNLKAWQLWYCFDNDTTRFEWADATNGTGVIYRMIDEFGNDCPYDFKNIRFDTLYTFSVYFEYMYDAILEPLESVCVDASLNYTGSKFEGLPGMSSATSLTITTVCKNNKITYNTYSSGYGINVDVDDLSKKLYKNCIVFNLINISGNVTVDGLYCINNYINGVGNVFVTSRGLGNTTKLIANNKLYNCFNVVTDETADGANSLDALLVNNVLYNINYDLLADYSIDQKPLTTILSEDYQYKITGQNRFVINGIILADHVYQSNL